MEKYAAVGRRKTAVARVIVNFNGEGKITINRRPVDAYFPRQVLRTQIMEPMTATNTMGSLDISANVRGGGLSGQAGAVRLGIARALVLANPEWRTILRQGGFLTRDPRMVERKKYGQPGARKRFQFSKR